MIENPKQNINDDLYLVASTLIINLSFQQRKYHDRICSRHNLGNSWKSTLFVCLFHKFFLPMKNKWINDLNGCTLMNCTCQRQKQEPFKNTSEFLQHYVSVQK